jgi:hypothetical protein
MEAQEWIELSKHITWPIVVIFICCVFFRKVQRLFEAIIIRIETGAPLETPWMSLGAPSQLSSPEKKEAVSDQHLALVHSSWRYPKKDRDFNKRMYCFAAIIQANPDVLERVESVTYFLPGWPEPYDRQKKRMELPILESRIWHGVNLH